MIQGRDLHGAACSPFDANHLFFVFRPQPTHHANPRSVGALIATCALAASAISTRNGRRQPHPSEKGRHSTTIFKGSSGASIGTRREIMKVLFGSFGCCT